MQVYFRNQPEFEEKVEKITAGGADKLQVVIDFDQTMTCNAVDGRKAANSFSAINTLLPEEFSVETAKLFNHYHAIEIDPRMTPEGKVSLMEEWWEKVIGLMIKHGLGRQHFEQVASSGMMPLREGVVDFFRASAGAAVQTIVFSAGMGDLIELVLKKNDIKTEQVHVTANFLDFDEKGNAVKIAGPMITSMNKTEAMLEGKPFFEELRRRRNVLLVGDGLHDVDMVDQKMFENVLKVGLLNQDIETEAGKLSLEHFLKIYEMVLVGDKDFSIVTELLKRILK